MLIDFLFELRAKKLPVSTHEWMALMEAMALGLHESSLDGFYHLCRTLCVKDIALYDAYDEAFLAYFKDVHTDALELTEELQEWLIDPTRARGADRRAARRRCRRSISRSCARLFEQRLKEQKERHDGGNRWIGTGGTSPFGTNGQNPTGMRVGGGGGRSAMAVADERRFTEYRRDVVLDVRQIDVALRGLRRLGREGAIEELDLDETIDKTVQERRRDRGRVPAAAPQPRQGRAADGRRRLDGSARRADEPAVHGGVAHRPVREVPQLLLPQLRLQLGLRGRAVSQGACRSRICSRPAIATRSSWWSATR